MKINKTYNGFFNLEEMNSYSVLWINEANEGEARIIFLITHKVANKIIIMPKKNENFNKNGENLIMGNNRSENHSSLAYVLNAMYIMFFMDNKMNAINAIILKRYPLVLAFPANRVFLNET